MNPKVTALVEELRSPNAAQRMDAAERLMQMGVRARSAGPALAVAAGDLDDIVREAAVGALDELGPPEPAAIAELVTLLESETPDTVYWAATLLGRLEAAAAPAVPALTEARAAGRRFRS
jgi:HEAT repeat protein